MTFSNIAVCGFSLNSSSTAARNVSPEQPLSSMSSRLFDLSMEKFLQDVPATNILVFGIFFSCPYTSSGVSPESFVMSGYKVESKFLSR